MVGTLEAKGKNMGTKTKQSLAGQEVEGGAGRRALAMEEKRSPENCP